MDLILWDSSFGHKLVMRLNSLIKPSSIVWPLSNLLTMILDVLSLFVHISNMSAWMKTRTKCAFAICFPANAWKAIMGHPQKGRGSRWGVSRNNGWMMMTCRVGIFWLCLLESSVVTGCGLSYSPWKTLGISSFLFLRKTTRIQTCVDWHAGCQTLVLMSAASQSDFGHWSCQPNITSRARRTEEVKYDSIYIFTPLNRFDQFLCPDHKYLMGQRNYVNRETSCGMRLQHRGAALARLSQFHSLWREARSYMWMETAGPWVRPWSIDRLIHAELGLSLMIGWPCWHVITLTTCRRSYRCWSVVLLFTRINST